MRGKIGGKTLFLLFRCAVTCLLLWTTKVFFVFCGRPLLACGLIRRNTDPSAFQYGDLLFNAGFYFVLRSGTVIITVIYFLLRSLTVSYGQLRYAAFSYFSPRPLAAAFSCLALFCVTVCYGALFCVTVCYGEMLGELRAHM